MSRPAPQRPAPPAAGISPHDDARAVAEALALLWTYAPRTAIYSVLAPLDARHADGRPYSQEDVRIAIRTLRERGWIEDMPRREGHVRLREDVRGALYRDLVERLPAPVLRQALQRMQNAGAQVIGYHWTVYDAPAAIAVLRLEFFLGAQRRDIDRLRAAMGRSVEWNDLVRIAVFPAFDPRLFERVDEAVRWDLALLAIQYATVAWDPLAVGLCDWALETLDHARDRIPPHVRAEIAELALHRDDAVRMERALEGMRGPRVDAARACGLVHAGRFPEAQVAFEAALKALQAALGARKRILPPSTAWLYPLSLLAQQTPAHLERARKFCIDEAGTRNPPPDSGWGRWVHAVSLRLGDAAPDTHAFRFQSFDARFTVFDALWEVLLAAWLGRDVVFARDPQGMRLAALGHQVQALRERLVNCRLRWLEKQLDAAHSILEGGDPPAAFFVPRRDERWKEVLAALQALGTDGVSDAARVDATRIVWALDIDGDGRIVAINPLERKRGARGFGKPKPISLTKVARDQRLAPWDARVARAIGQERYGARGVVIDRAAAMMALIGHPHVAFADDPEQLVDVVEGKPEIEVVQEGDRFVLRVTPELPRENSVHERMSTADMTDREAQALRSVIVVRESPQRVRVIRFTAAQRRAAQLVTQRFAVPASARVELQTALRALASHFEVHTDDAQGGREIAAETRLRAELAPAGAELRVRLVAAPLGAEGPRVTPGAGRTRVMAAIAGETTGTRRDLAAERANIDAVLEALPFLDAPDNGRYEWVLADPDEALTAVETLPQLGAVCAVDWPKGKPVRVITLDAPQLQITVRSERDWFGLRGRAAADEGVVLELRALLDAARSRSRFVPMSEGVYVALTRSLKARLADIAAVAEAERDGVRVPRLAAAWLDEALEEAQVDSDAGFRSAIEHLQRMQADVPPLPRALQAELRPYQEAGYHWAMRLAAAGLGGCLADDMGLGKTLQALAVLLARGAEGPALVIAPTSVCGNWLAEARRFAPTLEVTIYGEGDRESAVAEAGPMDVIVVSYTLLQQAQERFAAREWHTIVADEAQAIKNASAKRSLAVFDLAARFRLALSGTPVENRLAELWSIMRFANPGLLGTLPRFTERFATPIERENDREAQHMLKRVIAPFVLRRTKAQVLPELPPRTEMTLDIVPAEAEAAHYEALRRQAVEQAAKALTQSTAAQARLNILAQLTRLRRAACDPRLVSPELGIVGAKLQRFAELAAELVANGHKALVFSQFVDFLLLLREPLDTAGIAYQYLDGSTPAAERTRRVAAFQAGQGELFLVSLKAGGFGLNLTAADYVLITDPWWNPAAEDQATGRAHRIGQSRPVTVYRLVSRGTVEERIVDLHRDKRALADSILDEGGETVLPSADDLLALLRDS